MKHLRKLTEVSKAVSRAIGMEAIHFQDGSFFRDLTVVIAPYVDSLTGTLPSRNDRAEMARKIAGIVKRYTNLTINPIWGHYYAIAIPDWNRNHVLMGNWAAFMNDEDSTAALKKQKKERTIKGSVDIQKGWVEGFYAEHTFDMYIGADEFTDTAMKAEHHASSIMHELGHAFTMCEMIDRVVQTNQILSRMHRELVDVDPVKRQTIIKHAGKDLDLKDKVVDSAVNSASTEVITTVMLTGLLNDCKTNTKSPYYNVSSAEQMADEFATRMGAGGWLVDNLDKMGIHGSAVQKRGRVDFYILEFVKTALTIVSLGFLPVFALSMIWVLGESTDSGGVYDTPHDRFKRVRNGIVEGMKNFNVSKQVHQAHQEQLDMVDAVLKNYTNRQQWWGTVFDFLFNNKGVKDRDFQQQLEALASNELFSGAQLIKHL